jgi:hypothetical protein
MKRRRIAITAIRRRTTFVLPNKPPGIEEVTQEPLAGETPHRITNITTDKRRDDYECKDKTSDDPARRRSGS